MSKIKQKKTLQTYTRHVRSPYLMTLLFCLLINVTLLAQEQTVSGTVTDESGAPLPGANVLQRGTSNGVVTDFDGNYTLILTGAGDKTLVFSYVGFVAKEIPVGVKKIINTSLEADSSVLDEVVVIGYGAVSRKNILGSVASVKADEVVQATPVSTFDAIQGRLSGVQILNNGQPGEGFDIKIRGTSTFSAGGTNPLYVVDGQQLDDINNLDPNDIETLEVLKDGATAAIYGSKAANGVVIIKTKSGRAGDIKLVVTHTSAVGALNNKIPLANSTDRIFFEDVRRPPTQTFVIGGLRDTLSLLRRNSFDLQDLITRTASRTQTNVAISGGGDKGTFYWNTGLLNEDGIVINSFYKRINTLLKIDTNLSKKLRFGTKLNATYEERNGLNESFVFLQMVERIPYFPIFEPDGSFTPTIAGRRNPLAQAALRKNQDRNYRAQLFNYGEWKILPSLSFKSTLGVNFRYRKIDNFAPILSENDFIPNGRERSQLRYDIQHENFLNYKGSFGNHNLAGYGGVQLQKFSFESFDIQADFVSDEVQTFNNIDPTTLTVRGANNTKNNLFSTFLGISYDYDNKYLLSSTIRRDGSSRFGADRKYGNFLSGSAGWRISSENFMSGMKDVVNNLLLRVSYGETGNERIGPYESQFLYVPNFSYNGNNGVRSIQISNPNLGWESTISTNYGVDLAMFNNRFKTSIDVWTKETDGLLANVPLPEEIGFETVRKNVGGVLNQGIDIVVSGSPIKTQDFEWFSSFNLTYLENEVQRLDGGKSFISGGRYLIEEGQPIGNIFGYNNQGIYRYDESNAYADDGQRLTPIFEGDTFTGYELNGQPFNGNVNQLTVRGNQTPQGGDIIWEDLPTIDTDGDGIPDRGDFNIDQEDRQIIGNGLAKYFGGFFNSFKYKDLTLSALFDFNYGNNIHRRYDELRNDQNTNNETPSPERIYGAWMNPGDIAEYPRLLIGQTQNRLAPNSFYIEKGDFIKLRYVRLDYKMPKDLMNRISWMDAVSLNVSFNNFFTWTTYSGYNPELGSRGNPLQPGDDRLRYPNKNEIILGLQIQL